MAYEQNNKLKKNKYTGPLDRSEAFPMEIWEAVFGDWRADRWRLVEKIKNKRSLYMEVPANNDRDSSRKDELKQLKDDKKDATTPWAETDSYYYFFLSTNYNKN